MVDDEAGLRTLVRLYLSREGMTVDEAADGREALAKVDGGHYDLISLDLMLPEVDGWEV